MDVELYADPSCPWSWAAYLWLDRVAPYRQLRLVHRPYSLALRDGTQHLPPAKRRRREQAHAALRVAATIEDDDLRWAFYAAVARPAFDAAAAGTAASFDARAAATAVGLDASAAARSRDAAIDDVIASHMRQARQRLGCPAGDPRIPVLVIGPPDARTAWFGPLLDPTPVGPDALRLWDAMEAVGALPGVYEISRPRPGSHSLVAATFATVKETS